MKKISTNKGTDKPVVVSLCDRTGNMVRPWALAGYACYCIDVQHSIRKDRTEGNIHYVWGDVRGWSPPESIRGRIGIVFAFPPCTHVAVSGARDFRKKGNYLLRDALELFSACEQAATWSGAPYMIENPVGKFSDHMGKPNHIFQPWHFGDLWTKKTCLWTGNGFRMPQPLLTQKPEGVEAKIWTMPPSPKRADLRSETPPGFARAVYQANRNHVLRQCAD
ncbi:hypothetical protein [Candidatus Thiodiazotropha sp. CDECU1]|uniref:hypothetical protein n=1 Tax=Candidatus Thiodiazotropha sp. CDECU1 TaxID=3065865 RepID=UPI00292F8F32|nr:hypothetical protein [Candidatus Thiodiazotropha sp. CDECU1]